MPRGERQKPLPVAFCGGPLIYSISLPQLPFPVTFLTLFSMT
jgi:hypothetical protein